MMTVMWPHPDVAPSIRTPGKTISTTDTADAAAATY